MLKKLVFIILLFALTILWFQNCGSGFSAKSQSSSVLGFSLDELQLEFSSGEFRPGEPIFIEQYSLIKSGQPVMRTRFRSNQVIATPVNPLTTVAEMNAAIQALGMTVVDRTLADLTIYFIIGFQTPATAEVFKNQIEQLENVSLVKEVGLNYILEQPVLDPAEVVANSLSKLANDTLPGLPDAWAYEQLRASEAWDLMNGADVDCSAVTIAVLDSGIEYTHNDLAANMWSNPNEIADNGIDEDGNGYVDDSRGLNLDNKLQQPLDVEGHGTFISSVMGAVGNNSIGRAGICWKVNLVAIRVSDTADFSEGVNYAINIANADIINLSGGFPQADLERQGGLSVGSIRESMKQARDAGVTVVLAAGNGDRGRPPGINLSRVRSYPAEMAKEFDNIIVVASLGKDKRIGSNSNYGLGIVDLSAPGGDIYGAWLGNTYLYMPGTHTSIAAPFVTGGLALFIAYQLQQGLPKPVPSAMKSRLIATAKKTSDHLGRLNSGGTFDLYQFLKGPEASPTGVSTQMTLTIDGVTRVLELGTPPGCFENSQMPGVYNITASTEIVIGAPLFAFSLLVPTTLVNENQDTASNISFGPNTTSFFSLVDDQKKTLFNELGYLSIYGDASTANGSCQINIGRLRPLSPPVAAALGTKSFSFTCSALDRRSGLTQNDPNVIMDTVSVSGSFECAELNF